MKNLIVVIISITAINVCAQTQVKVGVYIKNLVINNNDGTFYSDFYWWCKVPRTVNQKDAREYAKLEFVNSNSELELGITEEVANNKFYYYTGFCRGNFNYSPNYSEYPIEKHTIPIIIESVNLTDKTIELVADSESYTDDNFQGYNKKIKLQEFSVVSSTFSKEKQVYNTSFGDPEFDSKANYSRLNYNIYIERNSYSYLLKIIIPCVLLSLIAYLVFFIPASKLDVAVGCTVTSLLAAIAVQLTTVGDIPRTGYLTNSDRIYYMFYIHICIALIQTVITYNLENNNQLKLSKFLEISGRIIFPISLGIGLLIILS